MLYNYGRQFKFYLELRLFCFYEIVFFSYSSYVFVMIFVDCLSSSIQVQLNSVDCVVVIWDDVVYVVWVRVSINNSKYWNIQVVCFFDSDVFVICVDYEQSVRQVVYIFDIVKRFFQFFYFVSVYQSFFFSQFVKSIVSRLNFQFFQMFD